MRCVSISRQRQSRGYSKQKVTITQRLLEDVQRQLNINTCDSETLDGLCFRGEQLARQIASLVTGNVVDSNVLNHLLFAYEKLILCSQQIDDD